jgi:predicted CoA-binding protein
MQDEDLALNIVEATSTIALVGASPSPLRESHRIMAYLLRVGFDVIPVNPMADEVLGRRTVKDVRDISVKIDTVVCFRRSEEIEPVARSAIAIGAKHLWMQLGVVNQKARDEAEAAGLLVVMDRCFMIDHRRLMLSRS